MRGRGRWTPYSCQTTEATRWTICLTRFRSMDEIVNVAKGKALIIVDGSIRRGSDVLKGLAFGADLVGLGRPILYGLAADGEQGRDRFDQRHYEGIGPRHVFGGRCEDDRRKEECFDRAVRQFPINCPERANLE